MGKGTKVVIVLGVAAAIVIAGYLYATRSKSGSATMQQKQKQTNGGDSTAAAVSGAFKLAGDVVKGLGSLKSSGGNPSADDTGDAPAEGWGSVSGPYEGTAPD